MSGTSIEVICTTQDRIARTGFAIIEKVFKSQGGRITTIDESTLSSDNFPVDDLIGFITSYINSYHGKRSKRRNSNYTHDGDRTCTS